MPSGNTANTSSAAVAEGRILAARLSAWRSTVIAAAFDAGPVLPVVLTTSPVGLDVAADLLATLAPGEAARFLAVTEKVYRGWCMQSPDDDHRLHRNLWSWLKAPLPAARRGEFARWPIGRDDVYWLHRQGGQDADHAWRTADLYRWDGVEATLLATDVEERFHGGR
jgi:hypothetical protein